MIIFAGALGGAVIGAAIGGLIGLLVGLVRIVLKKRPGDNQTTPDSDDSDIDFTRS